MLPRGSGGISGGDISGLPVQRGPRPVIAHRGAWIGVRGGLRIPQRDPGIQRRHDERAPQRMRSDGLGDPGAAGQAAHDPPGAVPVQPPITRQEDRPLAAFTDSQAGGL